MRGFCSKAIPVGRDAADQKGPEGFKIFGACGGSPVMGEGRMVEPQSGVEEGSGRRRRFKGTEFALGDTFGQKPADLVHQPLFVGCDGFWFLGRKDPERFKQFG